MKRVINQLSWGLVSMQPVDGILIFHFPILLGVVQVLLSPDAGSSIDSWADQA